MINEKNVKRYCCEDISLIENYQDAINDKERTWDCHHRLETDLCLSTQELIDSNRYWKVEAKYLIFLRFILLEMMVKDCLTLSQKMFTKWKNVSLMLQDMVVGQAYY